MNRCIARLSSERRVRIGSSAAKLDWIMRRPNTVGALRSNAWPYLRRRNTAAASLADLQSHARAATAAPKATKPSSIAQRGCSALMPSLHSSPAKTRCAAVRMAQTGSGVSGTAAAAAIEGLRVFLTESRESERSRAQSAFSQSRASSPLNGSTLAFIRSRLSDGPESLAAR